MPDETTMQERLEYRLAVETAGLRIVSLHALLYGRPDLGIFSDIQAENKTIEYLKALCNLAKDLGASVLIFGSPANRLRKGLSVSEAMERSISFFSKVAECAYSNDVCLCIEPLGPTETDFVTSAMEGLELVRKVNHKGFGLHLDSKALSEEEEDVRPVMRKAVPFAKHFHISEPDLGIIHSSGIVKHQVMGEILQQESYNGFVSIEMRIQKDYYNAVRKSIFQAKNCYFNLKERNTQL